jgi:DNA replication regulator DPB11
MGADHKLDLTSDTTHLIVGCTDTLKYQYVAREREDIKVLRPGWIEAVRDRWMNALALDLDALAQEYRVPTLSGLKICITGFDDINFRAQLQKNVKDNGGDYTGDLTKDVTHLIAAKPEGKKYEYGMQWQKKVVSLKWYKESLERGMQLDESLYHPSLPVAEQGVGAWNRKPRPTPHLGKRPRDDVAAAEPSRKLRRTASARLGSQNQGMWSDIVGGAGFDVHSDGRPPLKPSVSMPALREPAQFANETTGAEVEQDEPEETASAKPSESRLLNDCFFLVKCPDPKKNEHLRRVVTDLGGTIVGEDETQRAVRTDRMFVILPHDVAKNGACPADMTPESYQPVSELWLEKCMISKSLVPCEKYPLGMVITEPRSAFQGLTLNVSGFDGLETTHMIKIVALLGGTYSKTFTAAVSVLVCRGVFANQDKLELARHFDIPVVNENWFWATMKSGVAAQVQGHLIQARKAPPTPAHKSIQQDRSTVRPPQTKISAQPKIESQRPAHHSLEPTKIGNTSHTMSADDRRSNRASDVHQEGKSTDDQAESDATSHTGAFFAGKGRLEVRGLHPLQEVSPTSARRNGPTTPVPGPQYSFDGPSSVEEQKTHERQTTMARHGEKVPDIAAINGAIRDLLDARPKNKASEGKTNGDRRKKGRLIGRALSNLSNSSAASNARHSRASSINSLNTDGLGSELPTSLTQEPGSGEAAAPTEKGGFALKGRAKTTLNGLNAAALAINDHDLARSADFPFEQEAAPRMTQLGYEDPEEAILLREKLAASRKKQSKRDSVDQGGEGQEDSDSRPVAAKAKAVDRKIRDDDTLAGAGWGAGRRTRHKQRSPPGMKDF